MVLYKHWFFSVLAWGMSLLSFRFWPKMSSLDLKVREDLIAAIFYRPFNFALSLLLLVWAIMIVVEIFRKVLYEARIAYLFKVLPYEAIFLLLVTGMLLWKQLQFYPLLGGASFLFFSFYQVLEEWLKRRKESIFTVKEKAE